MMNLLAEKPLVVSIMLGCIAAGLIYGWLQSGKKAAALVGLVCLILIPGAWALASNWQTDREQISEIIYATADAVAANDHDRAVAVIGNEKAKQMAMTELPNYIFDMAKVNQLDSIRINEGSFPMTAFAELSVKADVSSRRGQFKSLRVLRKLELDFEKRGNDWVVVNYHHSPVIGNGP